MDMNPKVTDIEKGLLDQVLPLRGKHIFTKNYGDGEIDDVTRKNDLSGIIIYFHSNLEGVILLDGEEFLSEVDDVKDIKD
ncbi:hypothetical protein ACFVS2_26850 [Brevibacillus sp. NPDC058079]|uniref:hypothetical protein n=1 Tax=Brevibacillus sp. NPDC058079 TaxID=3346330 RepID=UPI0036E9353A